MVSSRPVLRHFGSLSTVLAVTARRLRITVPYAVLAVVWALALGGALGTVAVIIRQEIDPDIEVVAEASNGIEAVDKAARALKRDFGEIEHLQASLKGPANFVTAADQRAEEILREELGLTSQATLSDADLASVDKAMLAEEKRAYSRRPQVFGPTAHIEKG